MLAFRLNKLDLELETFMKQVLPKFCKPFGAPIKVKFKLCS